MPSHTRPVDRRRVRFGPIVRRLSLALALVAGVGACSEQKSAVETAESLLSAMDGHDAGSLDSLLAPDAFVNVSSADSPETLMALFGWFEAAGWRFDNQGCTESEPEVVTCEVLQRNEWSEALGADPVGGTLEVEVSEGMVDVVFYRFDLPAWSTAAFGPFYDFVQANHEADIATMWEVDPVSGSVLGPKLTQDAIDLFEQHSTEFARQTADS